VTKHVTKNVTEDGAEAVVGAAVRVVVEAVVKTAITENTAERGHRTETNIIMVKGEREDPNPALVLVHAQPVQEGIKDMSGGQEVRNAVRKKLLPLNEWA